MAILAPSILDADLSRMREILDMLAAEGISLLHLDVMDGHFVPNLTFGPPVVASLLRDCPIETEAHLMVSDPMSWIEGFAACGCSRILVHPEGALHLHRVLQRITAAGLRPGVALNPATPLSAVEEVLPMIDMVLVMTVNPGFGGQKMIVEALDKVSRLAELRRRRGLNFLIEIDGGVNPSTLRHAEGRGVDVFVAGSAIFKAADPARALAELKRAVEGVE